MKSIKEILASAFRKQEEAPKKIQPKESIQLPILPAITEVKEFALNGWELGETHGLSHWERVERNGIVLGTENGCIRNDII